MLEKSNALDPCSSQFAPNAGGKRGKIWRGTSSAQEHDENSRNNKSTQKSSSQNDCSTARAHTTTHTPSNNDDDVCDGQDDDDDDDDPDMEYNCGTAFWGPNGIPMTLMPPKSIPIACPTASVPLTKPKSCPLPPSGQLSPACLLPLPCLLLLLY